MSRPKLSRAERRAGIGLSLVLAFRMLGLFLIVPVFSLLARDLAGQTPLLIGLAIGIYGLGQALLQQPFGHFSDRLGRRPVLLFGLLLFVIGGLVAAASSHIYGVILGRAIQGCGAVAAVALALAGDITRPVNRPVVMAIIGMGIGASFLLSILISVPLANLLGLRGLFVLTAVLGLVAIFLVCTLVPRQQETPVDDMPEPATAAASGVPLWILNIGIFSLHASITVLFINFPRLLEQEYGWQLARHWQIYLPTMLVSALLVFPLLRRLGRHSLSTARLGAMVFLQAIALIVLVKAGNLPLVFLALGLYFLSFNLQEALFPAQVSILAGNRRRGRVMGQYTTFQFIGSFAGGVLGGYLLGRLGFQQALQVMGGVSLSWFAVLALYAWKHRSVPV